MIKVKNWLFKNDVSIFFLVNHQCKCWLLDLFMPWITQFGGAIWSIGLTLILWFSHNVNLHQIGKNLAVSLLLSHLIVFICKRIVVRKRPFQVLAQVNTGKSVLKDPSFPSGHATAAFCMATTLLNLPSYAGVGCYALAFAVACSRVYLGLHYPSDVLIGAGVGTATAYLFVSHANLT